MTENDAQQILLVRALERQPASATWTEDDRLHATQQALREAGPQADAPTFISTRARLACERLFTRKPALADLAVARKRELATVGAGDGGSVEDSHTDDTAAELDAAHGRGATAHIDHPLRHGGTGPVRGAGLQAGRAGLPDGAVAFHHDPAGPAGSARRGGTRCRRR